MENEDNHKKISVKNNNNKEIDSGVGRINNNYYYDPLYNLVALATVDC